MEIEGEKKNKQPEDSSSEEEIDFARPTPLSFKVEFTDASLEGKKLAAERIFVGVWGIGAIYLQALVKDHLTLVGRFNFDRAKQKALCTLYQVNNEKSNYVLIFNDDLPNYTEVNFSEFFFGLFDIAAVKKVISLHSVHRTSLLNFDIELERKSNKGPFLRLLNTSKAKKSNEISVARELEEGNIIEGLAADLLVFLELNNINADTYVAIIDESELTADEIKKYDALKIKYKFLQVEVPRQEYVSLIKRSNITLFSKKMYI